MSKARTRRLKVAYVAPELLGAFLLAGQFEIGKRFLVDGLPLDAKFLDVYYSPERDAFGFKFEHDSFEPAAPGESIPEIEIMITSVDESGL